MKKEVCEKKIFKADLVNLYQILIWIRERVSKFFPQKDLEKIELASEEVILNIIQHSYKKKLGKIEIEILVNEDLNLIFKDKGPKFNPLAKRKKINKELFSRKKRPGGLGLFIIFQCMDEIYYQRKDKFNILTLKKKRSLVY